MFVFSSFNNSELEGNEEFVWCSLGFFRSVFWPDFSVRVSQMVLFQLPVEEKMSLRLLYSFNSQPIAIFLYVYTVVFIKKKS